MRVAVRAGRYHPRVNTTEFPDSASLPDLRERVRVGQSKRAIPNKAEHAPPSKHSWEGVVLRQMKPPGRCGSN